MSASRLLRALRREPVDRPPIWLMRQAGRYLPEYRQVRQQAGSFLALCRHPELACEVTLQPLRRFALDAAIVFSDILVVPDVMGCGLGFAEGEGPYFARPVRTVQDIQQLGCDVIDDLGYVFNAIELIQQQLAGQIPLIGFTGSPWTLAAYMVEGQGGTNFTRIKTWLYQSPEAIHQLLQQITRVVIAYVKAQIEAGIDALMLFDTWGGQLAHQAYLDFSLAYMQQVVTAVGHQVPVTLFTKQGGPCLQSLADTGCAAVGVDWTVDLAWARQQVGERVALQGNLDPAVLLSHPAAIEQAVAAMLSSAGTQPGYVVNLGHGVLPTTPPEHVAAMIDALHQACKREQLPPSS